MLHLCDSTVAGPAAQRDNVLASKCEYPPFHYPPFKPAQKVAPRLFDHRPPGGRPPPHRLISCCPLSGLPLHFLLPTGNIKQESQDAKALSDNGPDPSSPKKSGFFGSETTPDPDTSAKAPRYNGRRMSYKLVVYILHPTERRGGIFAKAS